MTLISGAIVPATPNTDRPAWSPIDLVRAPFPPVPGVTGQDSPYPPPYSGSTGFWGARLDPEIVGIDIDDYGEKHGRATVTALEAELGPLPATYKVTSRGFCEPGGKYLYRVRPGTSWHDPGTGVEVLHNGWRYIAMGVHAKTRTPVEVYGPEGNPVRQPPRVSEVPWLPQTWAARLSKPLHDASHGTPDDDPDRAPNPAIAPMCPAQGIGSRTGSEDYAGGLFGYAKDLRKAGAGENFIFDAISRAAIDKDPGRPWTGEELEKIASESVKTAPTDMLASMSLDHLLTVPGTPVNGSTHPLAGAYSAPADPSRFTRRKASTIEAKRVPWLYEPYLVRGAINLLAGYEGDGKSTITADFVARVTRGRFAASRGPETVLMVCTEDAWEYTIVPRLITAGADLDRVEILSPADHMPELTFPDDCLSLEQEITACGAALLVLDPVLSRLTERLDSHKDAEVRRGMEPLSAVLNRTGCAALGLMHFNKNTASSNPLDRLMASRAWSSLARSTLAAVPHSEDESLRVLAHAKTNVGPKGSALPYRIVPGQPMPGGIQSSRVEYLTPLDDFFLADALAPRKKRDDPAQEAAVWLSEYLRENEGIALANDVLSEGRESGHSERALKQARGYIRADVVPVLGMPCTWAWCHGGTEPGQIAVTLQHRARLSRAGTV